MPSKLSVSIIIPTYNGLGLLKTHLPGVVRAAKGNEIIVVDDASTDDTTAWLSKHYPAITVIKNDQNLRFGRSVNKGVRQSTGQVIVLLNSDVEPDGELLTPLPVLFDDPQVFAVGFQETSVEHGKQIIQGRACGGFKRGLLVHWRCEDQSKNETLWAFGGSGAFRKDIWLNLGGFDPLFSPAYEEDRDLCYRSLKRGYKILFSSQCKVWHQHESTNRIYLGNNIAQITSFRNHLLIVWKNITHLPYLIGHLLWLPYHLTVTNWKTRGAFGKGFSQALAMLPKILQKRLQEAPHQKVSDVEILAQHQK